MIKRRLAVHGLLLDLSSFYIFWIFLLALQTSLVGNQFYLFPADNDLSNFSYGLNWLSLDPRVNSGQPGPLINIVSGLLILATNLDQTDRSIIEFIRIGIGLQFLTVSISALWFSWAGRQLALPYWIRLTLIAILFTTPPLMTFVGHWSYVFTTAVLGAPLGLSILLALKHSKRGLIISSCGCGVLAANYYPILAVACAFLLALGYRTYAARSWPDFSLPSLTQILKNRWLIASTGLITIVSHTINRTIYASTQNWPPTKSFLWVTYEVLPYGVLFLVLSVIIITFAKWDVCFKLFSKWFLTLFILSNAVLLPWYLPGLVGISGRAESLSTTIPKFVLLTPDYPWLIHIWLVSVMLPIVTTRRNGVDSIGTPLTLGVLVFCYAAFLPIALLGSTLLSNTAIQGIGDRIFIASTSVIVLGYAVILLNAQKKTRYIFLSLLICLTIGSFVSWYDDYRSLISANKTKNIAIDTRIDHFLKKNPTGTVVCVRNEYYSKYCSTAYAYNRYRTSQSLVQSPHRNLFNERVIYVWPQQGIPHNNIFNPTKSPYFVIAGDLASQYQKEYLNKSFNVTSLDIIFGQPFISFQ